MHTLQMITALFIGLIGMAVAQSANDKYVLSLQNINNKHYTANLYIQAEGNEFQSSNFPYFYIDVQSPFTSVTDIDCSSCYVRVFNQDISESFQALSEHVVLLL